jgi:hypothetical protein
MKASATSLAVAIKKGGIRRTIFERQLVTDKIESKDPPPPDGIGGSPTTKSMPIFSKGRDGVERG